MTRVAMRAGLWVVAGHAASQALRLASNLVLTRLLFPEAFGLMALVQIVLQGAQMFSDVGLRGSVVHHERGDDPRFLDTAWMLQIARGGAIWVVVSMLAWPMARLYEQPDLVQLIPVSGVASLILGFQSTALLSLQRHVRPERVVALEFLAQAIGVAAMIGWALASPSVWALVAGSLVSAIVRVLASHRLIRGYGNRLRFDREAARSMFRFGRWIVIGTILTFLLNQGDRLVLGKLLSASELGVYTIAFFLSQATLQAVQMLSVRLLFPLYARLQERSLSDMRRAIGRARRAVLAFALPLLWVCALLGPEIVELLYDPRYREAGWMLQILAVGASGAVVGLTAERILLARGDSFRHMILQGCHATLLLSGIALGAWLGGLRGLLLGVSAARILGYLPFMLLIRRTGIWQPGLDALAFALTATVLVVGFALRGTP